MRKHLLATAHHSAGAANHDRTLAPGTPGALLGFGRVCRRRRRHSLTCRGQLAVPVGQLRPQPLLRHRRRVVLPRQLLQLRVQLRHLPMVYKRRKHHHLPGYKCLWVYLGSFLLVDPALTMVLLLARRAAAVTRLLRRKELVSMSRESHAAHLLVDGCERHLLGLQLLRQI